MEDEKGYLKVVSRIAKNIKAIRKAQNLTQEDMSDLGFSYRHFQSIESGTYSPNLHTLYRIARALKVDIRELLK